MGIVWGIDVGVASLGFSIVELDKNNNPSKLVDGVSIVYHAPTGASERTKFKSKRTQYKRRSKRMKDLQKRISQLFALDTDFDIKLPQLKNHEGKTDNSRIRLRAHGLMDPLDASDLARAILHIAKNRGIRLTRGLKDEASGDETAAATNQKERKKQSDERKKQSDHANDTRRRLSELGKKLGLKGDAHPSQLLMEEAGETGVTRLKKDRENPPVFTRTLIEQEFAALMDRQKATTSQLTDEVIKELTDTVFFEEELKPQQIGKCLYGTLGSDGAIESRCPRGSNLFQTKRIYEEINNIRIIDSVTGNDKILSVEQRDALADTVLAGTDLSAAGARSILSLGKSATANKTNMDIKPTGRKTTAKILGHPLAAAMKKADAENLWSKIDDQKKEDVTTLLRDEDDIETLNEKLSMYGFIQDQIKVLSDVRLPAAYSAAGPSATKKLLNALKQEVITNYEAEIKAGLERANAVLQKLSALPYYGEVLTGSCVGASSSPSDKDEVRFGKIPNPVVHVALNQIRKIGNSYIKRYGKPDRICIELARDMANSAKKREELEQQAKTNREKNEEYAKKVPGHQLLDKRGMQKLKLHEIQKHECLYTGKSICIGMLSDGSVEVDHILPRAITMDDGINNLALVIKTANKDKAKRTPFEAFSGGYQGQSYPEILDRAQRRGKSVFWRFKEDALDRFKDENAFRERFLNDTRYIGKTALQYLRTVCKDPNETIALNGRITANLRRQWGLSTLIGDMMIETGRVSENDVYRPKEGETLDELRIRRKANDKIRWDHRHHLVDAIVAACTTRRDVQRLQNTARQYDLDGANAEKILADIRKKEQEAGSAGFCWDADFRGKVKEFLSQHEATRSSMDAPITLVVQKAEHAKNGELHKETNYSVVCEVKGRRGKYVLKDHVAINSLLKKENIDALEISDSVLKEIKKASASGQQFWWGGNDPVTAVENNLKPKIEALKQRLIELMDQTPESQFEKRTSEKGKRDAKAIWATKTYMKETGEKRYTRLQVGSARVLKGAERHNTRPKRVNITGSNESLIYFISSDGDRDWEVISRLDANNKNFKPRWKEENGQFLFQVRKGDLIEISLREDDKRLIYKLIKFSPKASSVDLDLLPVEEARSITELPKTNRLRISSIGKFNALIPRHVTVDPSGRIKWQSRLGN